MVVEQPVEGLGAAGQFQQAALQGFSEGVEQGPDVARLEVLVTRFPPFVEHRGDETVAAHPDIVGADHEIVGGAVIEIGELVVGDAGVLVMPALHQFADCSLDQTGQITNDISSMLASQFHLARE